MYRDNPHFDTPADETRIWRYMTLGRFFDLLQRQSLWFARPDTLGDAWEGAKPRHHLADEIVEFLTEFPDRRVNREDLETFFDRSGDKWKFIRAQSQLTGVNCWHMADNESVAMWNVYCRNGEGLAIQSTFARLRDSLSIEARAEVFIGKVRYVNYEFDSIPSEVHYQVLLHKRLPFQYERELRAMTVPYASFDEIPTPVPRGWPVRIDVPTLIEAVYVAPERAHWLTPVVERAATAHGFPDIPVRPSEIAQAPYQ